MYKSCLTQGQIQLTTKKKSQNGGSGTQVKRNKIGRNLKKSVNQTGKISLNTKSAVHQYLNPIRVCVFHKNSENIIESKI